jgi:hypothetical protein
MCKLTLTNVKTQITNYHNSLDYWLQTGKINVNIPAIGVTISVPVNWQQENYFLKPMVYSYNSILYPTDQRYGWNLSENPNVSSYRDNGYTYPLGIATEISSFNRLVDDPYEEASYVGRSRTDAWGAQSDPGWAALQLTGAVNTQEVDMQGLYGFGGDQADHSGIFNRTLQQLNDPATATGGPFFQRLMLDLTGKTK